MRSITFRCFLFDSLDARYRRDGNKSNQKNIYLYIYTAKVMRLNVPDGLLYRRECLLFYVLCIDICVVFSKYNQKKTCLKLNCVDILL
jgi:hypothetical protein